MVSMDSTIETQARHFLYLGTLKTPVLIVLIIIRRQNDLLPQNNFIL